MAKASKAFSYAGKHTTQQPTLGREAMMQLIRKCAKADKEATGKHEHEYVIAKYYSVRP